MQNAIFAMIADDSGAALVEYAVVLTVISAALVAAYAGIGGSLANAGNAIAGMFKL